MQQNVQAVVTQSLNTPDDKTMPMAPPAAQSVTAQQAQNPTPPGILSGIPLVSSGNFTAGSNVHQEATPQVAVQQQPIPQAQSMVSNMATYSSSKYFYIYLIQNMILY